MIEARQKALDIFLAGVDSVMPDQLMHRYVSVDQNILQIEHLRYDLDTIDHIYIVGAGKASAAMAEAIESILGASITHGHIVTKYNHSIPLQYITITEAGHPVPDENGRQGTQLIMSIAKEAGENDLVICLISGGGSALLTDIPDGCTLEDLKTLNSILLKSGADITEMNCIRKHLSNVKGGLLSRLAFPSKVVSLILSDVIGDPLDVIASGPTAPDPTTYQDAIAIIRKYNIEHEIPPSIWVLLNEGLENKRQETLKESDEINAFTKNLVIGTNKLALITASEKAESLGYTSTILTNRLQGDILEVAAIIDKAIRSAVKHNVSAKQCLLFGGEPTIKVHGEGLGGRNQHLALLMAKKLAGHPGITFLSGGTDGTDGPTDAAGAVVDADTLSNSSLLNLNIDDYIQHFDAYHFFEQAGGLIKTGPTQTNVMDLMVVLIN
jgi:glycerate-2-kinase